MDIEDYLANAEEDYAVITDNGGGETNIYHDVTGEVYTFPTRYRSMLRKGTKVIYHRAARKKDEPAIPGSMSDKSHYFGTAVIGKIILTPDGNLRADIEDYKPFLNPVYLYRPDGNRFEGNATFQPVVRRFTEAIYNDIVVASVDPGESLQNKKGTGAATRTGTKTETNLKEGISSVPFLSEGKRYKFVTGKQGYYLLSPDQVYYLLKEERPFPNWKSGGLRILLSEEGGRLLIHDSEPIVTIYRITNGFRYEDWTTREVRNLFRDIQKIFN